MRHFYHGLFGSPLEWDGLVKDHSGVVKHDLYAEDLEQQLSLKTSPEDVLIGYSMGGRIALEIARRNNFNLSKIILLSAHPGLSESERMARKKFEDEILEKMTSLRVQEFAAFWNQLGIFSSSELNQDLNESKLKKSSQLFDKFRLSDIPSALEEIKQHKTKIIWIMGNKDFKYMDLLRDRISPLGVKTYTVSSDHRVLKATEEMTQIFKEERIS